MIKLIVLDWDDCLVQGSSEAYYACYTKAITDNGIPIDPKDVAHHASVLWGRPHGDVVASIIGATHPKFDEVVSSYEQLHMSDFFSSRISLIPGSKEALLSLKEKYQLALASGMNGTLLRTIMLPRFGMESFFSFVISSSELPDPERGKPYPDLLLKVLDYYKLAPKEAIMVGDGKGDMLMAQAVGVLPVAVLTGQLSQDTAQELGVSHIIPSILELQTLVTSL